MICLKNQENHLMKYRELSQVYRELENGMKNKNQALGFIIQTYAEQHLPEMMQPLEKPGRSTDRKQVENVEELRKNIRE